MGILPLLALAYFATRGSKGGAAVTSKTAAKAWPQSKGRVASKASKVTKGRAASAAASAAKSTPHGRAAFGAARFARRHVK